MITFVRNFIQKKHGRIIILIIFSSFMLSVIIGVLFKRGSRNIGAIAFVDGYPISQREYQNMIINIQNVFKAYGYNQSFMPDIKKMAMNQMAQEKIVDLAIDKLGVKVSQKYIIGKLQDPDFIINYLNFIGIPSHVFNSKSGIAQEELKKYLKAIKMTFDEFDAALEHATKQIILGQLLGSSLYIGNNEIKNRYIKQFSQKKFTIYTVPLKEYIEREKKKIISEEELKVFFDRESVSLGKYKVPEKRDVKIWTFSPENYGIKETQSNLLAQKFKTVFKTDASAAFAQNKFEQFSQIKKAKLEIQENKELDKNKKLSQKIFKLASGGRDISIDQNKEIIKGLVVQVIKINPAYTPEFNTIKKEVLEDYYVEKARLKLAEDLKKASTDLAFLRSLKYEEKVISNFELKNRDLIQELSKKEVPIKRMIQMTDPNSSIFDFGSEQGFVIKLNNININDALLKEKTPELRQSLESEALSQAQYWFVASLARSVKIEMNNPTGQTELIDFE